MWSNDYYIYFINFFELKLESQKEGSNDSSHREDESGSGGGGSGGSSGGDCSSGGSSSGSCSGSSSSSGGSSGGGCWEGAWEEDIVDSVDDSVAEDDVRENDLSGFSSEGGDENSSVVGEDGDVLVVVGDDGGVSSWESSREDCDWQVDCVVEEQLRELERVEAGQVGEIWSNCGVDWDEDGDRVGGGEGGLCWHGDALIQAGEVGEGGVHLAECGGQRGECWIEDRVDDVCLSVGALGCGSVDWVSVDGDDWVEWGGVVVDTERSSVKGGEEGIRWEG